MTFWTFDNKNKYQNWQRDCHSQHNVSNMFRLCQNWPFLILSVVSTLFCEYNDSELYSFTVIKKRQFLKKKRLKHDFWAIFFDWTWNQDLRDVNSNIMWSAQSYRRWVFKLPGQFHKNIFSLTSTAEFKTNFDFIWQKSFFCTWNVCESVLY